MSADCKPCWVNAPAKINLTLEVLGRRPDGYHEVRSLLMPVDLCDRVELTTAAADGLEVVPDGVDIAALCAPERNLAMRALALTRKRHGGGKGGVHIRIVKRIPVGGGLGGGSADAAAVLIGLNRLWNLGQSRRALMALGIELGCDVPALIHGGAVIVEGRGEIVRPVLDGREGPVPGFTVVLANPRLSVSTAEAYRCCCGVLTSPDDCCSVIVSSVRSGDVSAASSGLFNGLEAGVFARYPEVGRAAGLLRAAGAEGVLMSGGGATVFALVADRLHGERVRRALPPFYWSQVARTLPDGVMVAHGPLEP